VSLFIWFFIVTVLVGAIAAAMTINEDDDYLQEHYRDLGDDE
jgi:hypothetical protein